ncbi:restriction endonuclease [Macrococcus sp. IME1552]|nr:HIRAN domain-containing protein [Macrococcus sp. IME1552]ATD29821.1 restriction endonuclease [Macrococcus sp. IME1552]
MQEIDKPNDHGLMHLIHNKNLTVPLPFAREIFLFDTYIAGTSHIEGLEELYAYLMVGSLLNFYREPDNPYDAQAIMIKNADGVKLGYIPKADNIIFSRLMDAGKLLFGKISSKSMNGNWVKIKIDIFLKD